MFKTHSQPQGLSLYICLLGYSCEPDVATEDSYDDVLKREHITVIVISDITHNISSNIWHMEILIGLLLIKCL